MLLEGTDIYVCENFGHFFKYVHTWENYIDFNLMPIYTKPNLKMVVRRLTVLHDTIRAEPNYVSYDNVPPIQIDK
jgi:hypothetical protein